MYFQAHCTTLKGASPCILWRKEWPRSDWDIDSL